MRYHLSRRTFLRGVGVTMALPWMESCPVWGDETAGSAEPGSQPPVRLAVVFSGNGFHKEFWAKAEGKQLELGKVLSPLTDFRERLVFIRGLYNPEALKGNVHSSQTGNLLSGAPLANGGEIRSGTSFDQIVAQRNGRSTKVPSLVLGCERPVSGIHKNYSMVYSSHISWSSPTAPTPLELYPALAFDRLFNDGVKRIDKSVLDSVLGDAKHFRSKISATDKRKLDEYLNSVREVESRIGQAGKQRELQGWRPTLAGPNVPRPAEGIPQNLSEHMRLMCDILVLAFQTDSTRVCTLKLNNDISYQRFPHLGIDVQHHQLSHRDDDDYLKVNQFFMEQFAYIAEKLDAIQEGERTALDNSLLMYCSSMVSGSRHDATRLPVVLLGSGGGRVQGGRKLDYLEKPNRKMCSLYLSMLDKFGIHLKKFGDSDQRLEEV